MQRVHFTNDGIYGEINKTFDVDLALRVSNAVAEVCKAKHGEPQTVYVTFDGREHSRSIARSVAEHIAGHGFTVELSSSYTPMPALNYALRTNDRAQAGIMITGDHRGSDMLGIRIRDNRGAAPHPSVMDEIEAAIPHKAKEKAAQVSERDFNTPFFTHASSWGNQLAIEEAKLTFLVDSMYGTAARYSADLLRGLGASVIEIHGNMATPAKMLHPEVVEPWIDECEYVASQIGLSAAIALDGPANRAAVVADDGTVISLAKISALFLRYLVEVEGRSGYVLCPRMSSFLLIKQARELGLEVRYITKAERWAAEEAVSNAGVESEALLVGDGINSLILPHLDPERDAFVIEVMLANVLAAYQKPLLELLAQIDASIGESSYAHKDVRMDVGEFEMLKNVLPGLVADEFFKASPSFVSHADGLYAQFENGSWAYVRPSRTEPLVHIYAEAPTKAERSALIAGAQSLAEQAVDRF